MRAIDHFYSHIPSKPYATDHLGHGLFIKPRKTAIKNNYIQANGPTHKHWMIFDVDSKTAGMDWYDQNAPTPNLVVSNPDNGHAHLLYALKTPVRTTDNASQKALKYAAAIECSLRRKLDGDIGYSGLICKNPLNNRAWVVKEWESELYSLDLLSDYLDLSQPLGKHDSSGLGRNCELFSNLSRWAVKERRSSGFGCADSFYKDVLKQALDYNQTVFRRCPLCVSEIKGIAKSVSRWVCRNITEHGFRDYQATVGKKGGKVSKGGGRPSLNEPWKALGISRATYFRRKKSLIQK